jgi:hypothetical protein
VACGALWYLEVLLCGVLRCLVLAVPCGVLCCPGVSCGDLGCVAVLCCVWRCFAVSCGASRFVLLCGGALRWCFVAAVRYGALWLRCFAAAVLCGSDALRLRYFAVAVLCGFAALRLQCFAVSCSTLGYFAVPSGALHFAVVVTVVVRVVVNAQGGSCLFPTVCVMTTWESSCVWMDKLQWRLILFGFIEEVMEEQSGIHETLVKTVDCCVYF